MNTEKGKGPGNVMDQIIFGGNNLSELLDRHPPTIARIMDTEPDQLLVISQEDLEKYIFDELLQRTRGGREISTDYILTLQYISHLLSNIRTKMEFDNYGLSMAKGMYVLDGMEIGDFKLAGDNAVFGHIHFVEKRHNSLSKKDYVDLAERFYHRWYERSPESIGEVVSRNVRGILEKIENWSIDMMKRVPGYQIGFSRI